MIDANITLVNNRFCADMGTSVGICVSKILFSKNAHKVIRLGIMI